MRVLGVDPGTLRVGWAVLEKEGNRIRVRGFGCIAAGKTGDSITTRAAAISDGLDRVVEEFAPDCMALEEAFFGRSARSALRIGEGRGFAIAAAARAGLALHEYAPRTVKKSAVGTGAAHKSQVQEMMRRVLGLPALPEPEDAADALAVAWCHCNQIFR
jgi:crossover junction endodeoxyribonuclease RuvC